jgi:hypothetical protein
MDKIYEDILKVVIVRSLETSGYCASAFHFKNVSNNDHLVDFFFYDVSAMDIYHGFIGLTGSIYISVGNKPVHLY